MSIPRTPPPKEMVARTPQEIAEERKENLIAFAVVILVIGAIAFFVWRSVTAPLPAPERVAIGVGNAPSIGPETAPVTVIIFSDFECPYCGDFARDTMPLVEERLVETGQVRVAFRHFPLSTHPYADRAAQAAACADDQGKFWEYHDLLYANQDALQIGDLQSYAVELGLNTTVFDACLLGEERANVVAQDRALGLQVGVTGTPTFFFNGRKVAGALTYDAFAAQVAQETAAE